MHSIHNRLFLLFLSCMMALLIIGSYLYYRSTTEIIHDKIGDMAEKNISQTAGLFDLLLEGYDSVTKSLNSNYELLRLLELRDKETNPAASANMERSITNILGAAFYSREDIIGIHVVTHKGKLYNYEKRFAGVIDPGFTDTDWFKKLKDSSGEMVWMGLYDGSVINTMQKEAVFVFGRQLYDLDTYKKIGVVFIETDPKPIWAAMSNVTISPNSRVYIANNENRIIATTEKDGVETPSFSGLPRPDSDHVIVDKSTDQLIVAAKAELADWTVFGLTPKADINAQVVEARKYLLIVVLLLVVMSTALATLISRNIASPLKLLIRQMRQVEMGNFTGTVNVNSFEEINSLVSSFNRMVHRMDELIERITLASISEKNAELQALQSQVNPHFLYNTLDMIYWMLDERENDRLGRVILALSHMFRYSSDWQEASRTTLRQELDQMRHYLTIIENRLEGRVRTEIRIDDAWLDVMLPKMTIQPIIENAVKSGLEPLNRPGLLQVYTRTTQRELCIVIEDNGIGMDERTLTELQTALSDGSSAIRGNEGHVSAANGGTAGDRAVMKRRGIGLPNVHRRIVLMFGEQYGLRIESKEGAGTTVTIAMPLPSKGRKIDEHTDR
ncbi:sensor histidine kinase [Paenibacillus spongiae]|uniref:histidine kinase n=1 Tax=Paenibacillus spongiae TaxID=2909671 RepID=A0ABY5SIG3_9BACL|nr:sensor histidine kinase [Paenibacillus spongiae]